MIRHDPSTGDIICSPRNRKFSDWTKLCDRLLARIPRDELKALDNLRDASLLDERADAASAKLAELNLSEQDISELLPRYESEAG